MLYIIIIIIITVLKYKPPGAYIQRANLTEGFLRSKFVGAYTWRGLFSDFYHAVLIINPSPSFYRLSMLLYESKLNTMKFLHFVETF